MKRLIGSTSSHPTGSKRGRGTGATALVAIVFGLMISLITVPVAFADLCPNSKVRLQTGSTELPDCRAYEMVSPPYKAGFPVRLSAVSDDGMVSFRSTGAFAGSPQGTLLSISYFAARTPAGWATTAPAPPEEVYDPAVEGIQAESADLRQSLWAMSRRDVPGDPFGFWLRGPDGALTRVGDALVGGVAPSVEVGLVSDDLSHVVFNYGFGSAFVTALREQVGTGNGPPRAVSVDNQGQPAETDSCPRSMSGDGRVIVFSLGAGCSDGSLRARVGGAVTLAVSGSECTRTAADPRGACNGLAPASYAGTAADGSRVFFTTTQQLVNDDSDATNDLYACDIPAGVPAPVGLANPCASLTQVSGTTPKAQVESVVAVSKDGSRVYFVAQGVLAGNLGLGDTGARAGVPNLYLWERNGAHPAGQMRFVAGLDAGNDLGGAQMTADGRYLLFTTANSFVTAGPGADTDGATDVYRYDADTPAIVRVSVPISGVGGNDGFDASNSARPSITSDGSTAIFSTAEALSQSDTNGVDDVYAWHEGHVSKISPNGVIVSNGGKAYATITPSGRDIYFTTNDAVLAADGDASTDIYDARIGGGFEHATTPSPCSGDECRGQRSQPPSLPTPPLTNGTGNVKLGKRSLISLKRLSAKKLKAVSRTGVLPVSVKSNSAGKLSLSARASMGRVARKTVRVRKAGTVKTRLRLSGAARQRLRSGSSLRITLSVSKKGARSRSMSVRLPGASS